MTPKKTAAALISVVQTITDRIGAALRDAGPSETVAAGLTRDAAVAFDDLDRTFRSVTSTPSGATS